MDALGYKRPAAYYRDVLWKTGQNPLSLFVKSPQPSLQPEQDPKRYLDWVQDDLHPNWTWPGFEGQTMQVEVYSLVENVELFLNGKSLGKQGVNAESEFKAHFAVPYLPGELKVVGYDNNGKILGSRSLKTTGPASHLQLTAERDSISADGQDLTYIHAQLLDTQGNPVYWWGEDRQIQFKVSGAGSLLATGNANPRSVESFHAAQRQTFRGKVVAVVRSLRHQPGNIQLSVSGNHLEPVSITLTSVE